MFEPKIRAASELNLLPCEFRASAVCVQGMKVSCTHFQCSAGAFSYLRDHFSHSFSVDMSHQILSLNINLMLVGSTPAGDQTFPWKRRIKSHHSPVRRVRPRSASWRNPCWTTGRASWWPASVLRSSGCYGDGETVELQKLRLSVLLQVVDYYKEACRALENSETASMLGKIQKDWKKLVQMKIYYFAAIAHVSSSGRVCVCVCVCVCKGCDFTCVSSVASYGQTS